MNFPTMDYFRTIHNSRGLTNARDAKAVEFQARFAADFDTSINVVHDALRNDVPQDFIIIPTDTGCNLWARPGETFNIGDIIYHNTLHWLVTDVHFGDDLTRSGEMVRCNRQIKWQNKRTGRIITRWCLATKPYTSNIAEGIAIANSNREYKIQLSYDDETIQVDLDDRFLLEVINGEPKAYQVTSVDTLTNRYQDIDGGFLIWNLKQCEYNPMTDNAEMMIADYYITENLPAEDPTLLSCVISGRETVRQGAPRTYTVEFSGATEPPPSPVWSCDDGLTIVEQEGNTVKVAVAANVPLGEHLKITVVDEAGQYQPATFYVEVVGLL